MTKKKNTTVNTNTEKETTVKINVSQIGKLETIQNNVNAIKNALCDILTTKQTEEEQTKNEFQEDISIEKYCTLLKVKERAESVYKLFDFIANG